MAASDHIQPRLFHGTGHYFSEGEKIAPSQHHRDFISSMLKMPAHRVYASSDIDEARYYAGEKAIEKGMLFAPVYEVEAEDIEHIPDIIDKVSPVSDISLSNRKYWKQAHKDNYVSTKPMTPKRIVDWSINPEIN